MNKIRYNKLPEWFKERCTQYMAAPADRNLGEWLRLDHHASRAWFRRFGRRGDALIVENVRPASVAEIRAFAAKIQATVDVADQGGTATFTEA